ncbi:STAS domain-containing protein [Streptomyces niveus]|uniref:STAS domain-containing protein n=1 Tax=Streptomyces niveus TaxID=193462 RepID=UPI0033C8CCB1
MHQLITAKAIQNRKSSLRLEVLAVRGASGPRRYGVRHLSWQADPVFEDLESAVTGTAENDAFIVTVKGGIDFDSAQDLKEVLAEARRAETPRTVVDLSGLMFADSAVLHVLLGAQREHRAAGRRMVVAGPLGQTVLRLFEVTGTSDFFTMAPTLDAALTS